MNNKQPREGFEAHINDCIESEGGLMQALQRDAAGDYVTHWVAEKFVIWQVASSKEREACAEVAKEQAAKYAPGGSLHTMMNIDTTRAAAAACEHVAHLINERGQA
jgi:hypothetical protein